MILEHLTDSQSGLAVLSPVGKASRGSKDSELPVGVGFKLRRNLLISGSHFKDQESHSIWNSFHPFQRSQFTPPGSHTLRNSKACPPGVLLHQAN